VGGINDICAMNKKGLLFVFTLYFFFATTGVIFGRHVCGKSVTHSIWSIHIGKGSKCTCNHNQEQKHKSSCCSDHFTWLKAKDTPIKTIAEQPVFLSQCILLEQREKDLFVPFCANLPERASADTSPPGIQLSLCIIHRSLLI
jgi:hypothetical protein